MNNIENMPVQIARQHSIWDCSQGLRSLFSFYGKSVFPHDEKYHRILDIFDDFSAYQEYDTFCQQNVKMLKNVLYCMCRQIMEAQTERGGL